RAANRSRWGALLFVAGRERLRHPVAACTSGQCGFVTRVTGVSGVTVRGTDRRRFGTALGAATHMEEAGHLAAGGAVDLPLPCRCPGTSGRRARGHRAGSLCDLVVLPPRTGGVSLDR